MQLGTMNFQVMAVESWQGAGSAQIGLAKGAATSNAAPTTTTKAPSSSTTTAGSAPTTSAGGSGSTAGSAQWGQCGGQGWTGPTTCQSPYTCHYSNPYYSQCY